MCLTFDYKVDAAAHLVFSVIIPMCLTFDYKIDAASYFQPLNTSQDVSNLDL